MNAASGEPEAVEVSEDAVRAAAIIKAACGDARTSLLVTGLKDDDEAPTIAAKLAAALAQMALTPLVLLDADLRSPRLHALLHCPAAPGLSQLVQGLASMEDSLCPVGATGLWFLPSGGAGEDPVAVVGSAAYTDLVAALRKRFRFVIAVAPSILDFPDAALIAPRSDGVVLVARAGHRARRELRQVKQLLDASNVPLVGVLLSEVAGTSRQ